MPKAVGTQPGKNVDPAREYAIDDSIRVAALAVAELGVPGLLRTGHEETTMAATWQKLISTIAEQYQVSLSPESAEKIVAAALSSIAPHTLGSKIVGWAMTGILSALTGTVVPAATTMNTVLDIVFTYRLGKECARRFAELGIAGLTELDFGRRLVAHPTVAEVGAIGSLLANRGRPVRASTARTNSLRRRVDLLTAAISIRRQPESTSAPTTPCPPNA